MQENPANQGNPMAQEEVDQCIQDCLNCHTVCTQAVTNCLQAGGEHAQPTHIQTLLDCAEICLTAAHFMIRNSALSGYTCQACMQVCDHTAAESERTGDTDVVNACRACVESCKQIVNMIPY
jgi:hypothetical protein